jgi:hypothetical protein
MFDMNSSSKVLRKIVFCLICLGCFSPAVFSKELSYDRYAPEYVEHYRESLVKKIASRILVYPLEPVRWAMNKGAVVMEKHRVERKLEWLYARMQDYGLTPDLNIFSATSWGLGVDLNLIRLGRLGARYPNWIARGWFFWEYRMVLETGAEIGYDRIMETPFYVRGLFNYQHHPEERFFGIGPRTSRGDGCSYRYEATTLKPTVGFSPGPFFNWEAYFRYRNVNIANGKNKGMGVIDQVFQPRVMDGLSGDSLLSYGTEIKNDTRDQNENSTQGGLRRFGVSYNHAGGSSKASYFKYEAEISQYQTLWSPQSVLAGRLYGEANSHTSGDYVPFYDLAKLGGYGSYPYVTSRTLRGYDFNRFTDKNSILLNLEYRYTIWQYRAFKADAVFFWDNGQVFSKISKFKLGNMRTSYGTGLRISMAGVIFLSTEIAHGAEGTSFYVKSTAPF